MTCLGVIALLSRTSALKVGLYFALLTEEKRNLSGDFFTCNRTRQHEIGKAPPDQGAEHGVEFPTIERA
jgi:hypothetical protein